MTCALHCHDSAPRLAVTAKHRAGNLNPRGIVDFAGASPTLAWKGIFVKKSFTHPCSNMIPILTQPVKLYSAIVTDGFVKLIYRNGHGLLIHGILAQLTEMFQEPKASPR